MTVRPDAGPDSAEPEIRPAPLRDLLLYFLRLGTFGFGGPIALVGYMQRDLVEQRRWISQRGLQGRARARAARARAAGRAARDLPRLAARRRARRDARRGRVRPAVVPDGARALGALRRVRRAAVDAGRVLRHRRRGDRDHRAQRRTSSSSMTLGADRLLWVLFAVSALVTAWTESEIVWLFVRRRGRGAGRARAPLALAAAAARRARCLAVAAHRARTAPAVATRRSGQIAWYFAEAGRVRVRQRAGDRAVPARRRRQRVPLADASASSSTRSRSR